MGLNEIYEVCGAFCSSKTFHFGPVKCQNRIQFFNRNVGENFFCHDSQTSLDGYQNYCLLHIVDSKKKLFTNYILHKYCLLIQYVVIFYTAMRKVVLWYFFTSETSEKIHNSSFRVKISV